MFEVATGCSLKAEQAF